MPFKIRRDSLFMKQVRIGSSGSYTQIYDDGEISQVGAASFAALTTSVGGGTSVSAILAGSIALSTSSITAASYEDATLTITGIDNGYKVYLSGCTASCEVMVVAASATGANTVTVTYLNTGSATAGASSWTVNYLAVRDA